jgi:hypothetical protein
MTVPPETIGITNGLPVHNDKLFVAILTVGVALTTIVLVAEFALTQPTALVPIKVYVWFELGDTVKLVPVKEPGFNV